MYLNIFFISLLSSMLAYGVYKYVTFEPVLMNQPVPWGQQVGKTKQIQSKTGDASLAIEHKRRRAIKDSNKIPKESRTAMGSTTGALETYFISYLVCCPKCGTILDGGDDHTESCNVYDGGNEMDAYDLLIDGKNDSTFVCGL